MQQNPDVHNPNDVQTIKLLVGLVEQVAADATAGSQSHVGLVTADIKAYLSGIDDETKSPVSCEAWNFLPPPFRAYGAKRDIKNSPGRVDLVVYHQGRPLLRTFCSPICLINTVNRELGMEVIPIEDLHLDRRQ